MEIRISVRNLVEFLMRGGDLDNRHTAQADNAMQAGSRVHREIQKNMGPEYFAEVTLRITEQFDDYALTIEGRADGIIERERMEVQDGHTGPEREVCSLTGEKKIVAFFVVFGLGAQRLHMGIPKPLFPLQHIVDIDISSVGLKALGFSVRKGIAFCYNRYTAPNSVFIDTCLRGIFAERFQKRERTAKCFI